MYRFPVFPVIRFYFLEYVGNKTFVTISVLNLLKATLYSSLPECPFSFRNFRFYSRSKSKCDSSMNSFEVLSKRLLKEKRPKRLKMVSFFLPKFKVEFLLIYHLLCSQEQACPQVNGGRNPRRSWGPGWRRQERWGRNLNTGAGGVKLKFQRERQTRKHQHPCHRSLASQLTGKQRIFPQQKGIVAELSPTYRSVLSKWEFFI